MEEERTVRIWITLPVAAALCISACGTDPRDDARAGEGESADLWGSCPDAGDRLPITGICALRAGAYLNTAAGETPPAPEGCEWIVQETRFGKEVLLYRATQCGSKTTTLGFTEGPGMTDLSYDTAAYGDAENALKGQAVARVAGADSSDKTATILRIARDAIDDPAEREACSVRNARIEMWPEDALVVDVSAAQAAKAPPDEPRSACGPFGLNEDETAFWRVFQGHSWFFQLGQDVWQVDPGSFTLLAKGDDGSWSRIE